MSYLVLLYVLLYIDKKMFLLMSLNYRSYIFILIMKQLYSDMNISTKFKGNYIFDA